MFTNQCDGPISIIWLDFQGNEVPYSTIKPREKVNYKSWVGHFWIVRDQSTMQRALFQDSLAGVRQVCIGSPELQTLDIVPPLPPLEHCERTHHTFEDPFKREAVLLLLCYNRLCSAPHESSCGDERTFASCDSDQSSLRSSPPPWRTNCVLRFFPTKRLIAVAALRMFSLSRYPQYQLMIL